MAHWKHDLNPYLFSIGDFSLTWYWLVYPVGFLVLFLTCENQRQKYLPALSKTDLIDGFLWGWLGMLLGARVGYFLIYHFQLLINNPDLIYKIWLGGMSFHGAIVGGAMGLGLVASKKKKSILYWSDLIVVFLPLTLLMGRLGNFLNGELWGRPSDLPWAVIFPGKDLNPRHPSQIYEALLEGLCLFMLLFLVRHRLWKRPGLATATFLIGYGLLRFLAELFREPDSHIGYVLFNTITVGQILCLATALCGVLLFYFQRQRSRV